MNAAKKAVIAGGGIGGLCAALCLHKFGWEVTVLEQAPQLGEVGAGIQISPNAIKVLRAIGVADAVGQHAFTPLAGEFRGGQSGRAIGEIRMGDHIENRHGAPYWHVHRADLIAALEQAVRQRMPNAIQTGARVIRYEQSDAGATALLENGERVSGHVLIGADGIKSAIRTQMLGDDQPRFTGNVAWRAVVPIAELGDLAPPPTACIWVGEGKHAVTYRIRGGTLANLVGVVERNDWTVESWAEQGTKQEALEDFAGWHPTIHAILEKADAHYRWALFDRDPLDQWNDGCVTMLGDACHPMLPFMAQGAGQAIEDGYVVASELATSDIIPDALSRYFTKRRDRTARVQKTARSNMGIFHQRTFLGKAKTYGPLWLASRIAPQLLDLRNDWIYGFDVTADPVSSAQTGPAR